MNICSKTWKNASESLTLNQVFERYTVSHTIDIIDNRGSSAALI